MISLSAAVSVIVWLLVAAVVFALLYCLIRVVARGITALGGGQAAVTFVAVADIVLLVIAILVLIGFALSFVTGQPIFTH